MVACVGDIQYRSHSRRLACRCYHGSGPALKVCYFSLDIANGGVGESRVKIALGL
jgi:hypothetical protein